MGIVQFLKKIIGWESDRKSNHFFLPAIERVDVERRSEIISKSHDFSQETAQKISECLAESMNESKHQPRDITKCIDENTNLNKQMAESMMQEQMGGVYKLNSILRYREMPIDIGIEWMPPGDGDLSPVCDEIASEIESRGGAVSFNSLYEIMRTAAENHQEGTPELVEYMIPHKGNCRCTISPVVGYSAE